MKFSRKKLLCPASYKLACQLLIRLSTTTAKSFHPPPTQKYLWQWLTHLVLPNMRSGAICREVSYTGTQKITASLGEVEVEYEF